jgi:hypothetical protein
MPPGRGSDVRASITACGGNDVVGGDVVNLPRYRLVDELNGVDGREDGRVPGQLAGGAKVRV